MDLNKLNKIVENHGHWLREDCDGWRFMRAKLRCEDLCNMNLSGADLRYADLHGVDLSGANLTDTDLRGVDLSLARLRNARLIGSNLTGANLTGSDLSDADLGSAILYRTALDGVNLYGAKNVPHISMACPSEGAFIGWKKVGDYIIKLEIPEDAKRCSATSMKCRCDKAKVLKIFELDGEIAPFDAIINTIFKATTYKVGEMVYPDYFDENRFNECSHGIHFFVDKQMAIDY